MTVSGKKRNFWTYTMSIVCFMLPITSFSKKFSYLSPKDRCELISFIKKDLEKFYAQVHKTLVHEREQMGILMDNKIRLFFENNIKNKENSSSSDDPIIIQYNSREENSAESGDNFTHMPDSQFSAYVGDEDLAPHENNHKNGHMPPFVRKMFEKNESQYICEQKINEKGQRFSISWKKKEGDAERNMKK